MSRTRVGFLLAGAALIGASQAPAHGLTEAPATLVAVSVQIDDRQAPLYPAPDGSGRYYLEARAGGRYSVVLSNRSGERVGVVLTVDGLNAISGERDKGRGRMYVLDPWQGTSVQGWRTSLQEVRQFTFIDERRSYATRTGQANEKMGWIEVAVYRERRALAQALPSPTPTRADPTRSRARRTVRPQAPAAGGPVHQGRERSLGPARRRRQAAFVSRHGLGPAHARPGRARQLRPRAGAPRAHRPPLRVPLGTRRARSAAHAHHPARPPLAARPRRARLRPAPALVAACDSSAAETMALSRTTAEGHG